MDIQAAHIQIFRLPGRTRDKAGRLDYNRNFPLEQPVSCGKHLEVLDDARKIVARFTPQHFVASAGFDIMKHDPASAFAISLAGLCKIESALAGLACQCQSCSKAAMHAQISAKTCAMPHMHFLVSS